MSDPTPFPTDPLEPEGTDPDLSKDDDSCQQSEADDAPDDREPTFEEQQEDRVAAEVQGRTEDYPPIA